MHFQRLRLTGFKSFVDPTEFRIEPGLTGVVGPNGCGKSNLLEALRWVMGANSAKAMRGSGMDDVIFAGTSGRPSRNHAEVSLSIDNADHRAPQPFTDAPVLDVVRRIDRGAGSTYRVNGKEVRARDVQLLFADASTGANSPALVRQGQISELIAAKPQNRRRILEEAGGVSGLHTRRHEAELRLRAAETNLSRLDDIGRELETTLARLKRESRHAERYRKISAEIRALQSALLFARWSDARESVERANDELDRLVREVEETARGAARAQAEALTAAEALKPLREEDAVAAAVLHRLSIEKDRIDLEERQARDAVARARAEIERIDSDSERELQIAEDARGQLARLASDIAALEAEAAAAPERGPELENAWKAAETARAEAEAQVERLASGLAAAEARATADAARLRDSGLRLAQASKALEAARAERLALGDLDDPEVEQARTALAEAVAVLQAARSALESLEAARTAATEAESESRRRSRELEDRLGRLQTEARGLAQLVTGARKSFPPALDSIRPDKGWETALAAALGDDLEAALDPKSPSYWAGRDLGEAPAWPAGVRPLADLVEAPSALAARLAWVGVVEATAGDALARSLPVGARLVSREGDLWRWDGFVARADAPRPAAVRLAQKARLAEIEEEVDRLKPLSEQAGVELKLAQARLQEAEAAVRDARRRAPEAERAVGAARETAERLGREHSRKEARAHALDETVARLEAEVAEAETAARTAREEAEAPRDDSALRDELEAARESLSIAREIAAGARSAFDAELRERMSREQRLSALVKDRDDWSRRAEATLVRIGALTADRERAADALARAEAAPETFTARRETLLDQFAAAETRRKAASDALGQAEAAAQEADRASRAADATAAEARERRAAAAARAESARERLTEAETQLRETAQTSPEELGRKLKEEAIAQPTDTAGAESLLYGLEREREALGLVNLRAEEEAEELGQRLQTMRAERADLIGAIAKLRDGIDELNAEGRERLLAAFDVINGHFQALFQTLFDGGVAELRLIESDDPLEAGLEIYACPPGKRLSTMSLMSGGEQALTATALIFGVFLANPAPVCVLDEVDAPLDDANVDRFCRMLDEMRRRTQTRFIVITHNPVTMARMDRLYGVTMAERGVSQLVSVDLSQAAALAAE